MNNDDKSADLIVTSKDTKELSAAWERPLCTTCFLEVLLAGQVFLWEECPCCLV